MPSANSRWCTKKLKLDPFEKFVGYDPVISYVGIRGDEDREGYISKKTNIQSIFPFRKNIWSEDVISKFLSNSNIDKTVDFLNKTDDKHKDRLIETLSTKISTSYSQNQKLNQLLNLNVKAFNHAVFDFVKSTSYPLALEENFLLLNNEDVLVRADIFRILEESGVGVPAYYKAIEFEINGVKSSYARSRSGCFFCFYQQKIEWVWLFEQHNDLYLKAMEYEKEGYNWMQDESLAELALPERIVRIKEEYIKRTNRKNDKKSPFLIDILSEAEEEGCASCFI